MTGLEERKNEKIISLHEKYIKKLSSHPANGETISAFRHVFIFFCLLLFSATLQLLIQLLVMTSHKCAGNQKWHPRISTNKQKLKKTYEDEFDCASSAAHVFPSVVMATPAMLTKTATTFVTFKES